MREGKGANNSENRNKPTLTTVVNQTKDRKNGVCQRIQNGVKGRKQTRRFPA